jgi:hypothetical protein
LDNALLLYCVPSCWLLFLTIFGNFTSTEVVSPLGL